MNQFTHIDLFAGPGGICTGFKAAGLNTLTAVEYVDSCAETYTANHPEVDVLVKDIRDVTDFELQESIKKYNITSVDVVSAGFPCETFSTAGSKSRVYDDHRNLLYKEAIRLANAVNAKLLVLENVPAFISKKVDKDSDTRVIDWLIEDLEKAGFIYHDYDVLNASDYGIPQNRKRFIMIASKSIQIDKSLFNGNKNEVKVTVSDALGDLPLIDSNQESDSYSSDPLTDYQKEMRFMKYWKPGSSRRVKNLTYHITPKHRSGTIERFKLIKQGEGLKDLFFKFTEKKVKSLQEKNILPRKWYIQRNQRLIPDGQSRTITSHCLDEIVHPTLHRGLSVREVARLQSFPDWYDFKGGPLLCPHLYKTQDKYEQIGDAVPPKLAKHIGMSIMHILSGERQISHPESIKCQLTNIK